jgi:hypothetical protein
MGTEGSLIVPAPIIHKSGVSKIDQCGIRRGEHTAQIPPPRCFAVVKSLETPAYSCWRFCYSRKRTYVSPGPVPRIFVVDDEPVIASTLAAILQMNGFSAKFFTCALEALTQPGRKRLICTYPTLS